MTTEADVRAALAQVIHPSFGLSLIALQMVRAVRLTPAAVEVDLVMNCAGCPGPEAALARARTVLQALDPERAVRLVLLPEPWSPPWGEWPR